MHAIVQDPANGHLYACGDATVKRSIRSGVKEAR